jgi:hypothetical protein
MKNLFLILSFLISNAMRAQCDEVPLINKSILEYVDNSIGKKIGRGECWDLAKGALDFSEGKLVDVYVFGRLLEKGECIFPGDIMQFENVKTEINNNGLTSFQSFPHHTAIVYEVNSQTDLILAHQNVDGKKKVVTSQFISTSVIEGDLKIYRPIN